VNGLSRAFFEDISEFNRMFSRAEREDDEDGDD
jgi:hypothetical protein